jgi:MtrB/PioB family decaheme-associated outer membrane protein
VALPIGVPARLSVTGAYGVREQDEDFLPHTINRQARGLPTANLLGLPQDSLDGNVDTWLANVLLTMEPIEGVDFDAHYRYYRLSNDTDAIIFPAHVVNDQGSISTDTLIADPNSYSRHNADASIGWQIVDPVRVELGYEFERWSRDESRNVRRTDEHGGHVAVDVVAGPTFRLNAVYELGVRRKDRYDPFASLENQRPLGELSDDDRLNFNLPDLRKYSQADRMRQEAGLIGTWLPCETLDVTLSFNWAQNDYDNTDYGIKDHEAYSAGIDVGYQPVEWLRLFGGYSYEVSEYRMRGRWRPRSFAPPPTPVDDFLNDWSTDSEDRAHFFNLGGTIGVIPDRLELEFAYLIQDAEAQTRSQGRNSFFPARPPTTSGDGGNAPSYPDIEDTFQSFQAVARYRVNERWTLKGGWRWEKFATTNFKLDDLDPFEPRSNINGSGVISPSTDVFLGNRVGDYDAHLFMLSVEFNF